MLFSKLVFLGLLKGFGVKDILQFRARLVSLKELVLSVVKVNVEKKMASRKSHNKALPVEARSIGHYGKFL